MGTGISMGFFDTVEDEKMLSLRPNYSSTNDWEICSTKMKEIHAKKFRTDKTDEERIVIPDILLDCESVNEMTSDEILEDWKRVSLEDMVSNVFTPNVFVTDSDMEDYFNDIETDLRFEENEYETEEDGES